MFTVLERSFDSKQSPKAKLNFLEASNANSNYFGQGDVTPKIVATRVKSLLQAHKTSYDGLVLLDCYLSAFPASLVQEEALFWTRSIVHLLAGKRPRSAQRAGWRLLCRLLPLLPGDVAGILPVLLERLLAQLAADREPEEGVLRCLLVCMKDYGRLMGSIHDALEKSLLRLLVTWNSQPIQELVCECVALLPGCCRRAGGGHKGGAPAEAWSRQLGRLMATVHATLDSLFQDLHLDKGRPQAEKAVPLEVPSLPEEGHQASLVCWRRIVSLLRTIHSMLLGPNLQQQVAVPVEDVLELVHRVLGAHLPVRPSGATAQANLVASILPSIQYEAVQLLGQLICCCRQILSPHADSIVSLIEEVVLRTTQDLSSDTRHLRQACYGALSLWLQTSWTQLGLGSLVEKLAPHLLQDIEPFAQAAVQLASRNNAAETPHRDRNKVEDSYNSEASAQLCEHALKALQSLVYKYGAKMEPETVLELQRSVVSLVVRLQQPGCSLPHPYRSPHCRRALYALLLSLATGPGGDAPPPPLHCARRLFSGGLQDACCEVSELCSQALACLSAHPRGAGPASVRAPALRCYRASWLLQEAGCQTAPPPTLASVGCQAVPPPAPAPRSPAIPPPQPLKRKAAAATHFRANKRTITTLSPMYRVGGEEAELLSDEDGHEYMDFQEEYEDAELEKLEAAEGLQVCHPPVNGQGRQPFRDRHLGAAGRPVGANRLVPLHEDTSEDEEECSEDYDEEEEDEEEEDEGDYIEEHSIEPIELESDEVDLPPPPPESDGQTGKEAAGPTVVVTPPEEDHEEAAAEAELEAELEAEPEAKPQAEPEAKPEAEPEAEPETKPETKPEAKPEAKLETEPGTTPNEEQIPNDITTADVAAAPAPSVVPEIRIILEDGCAEEEVAKSPPPPPAAEVVPAEEEGAAVVPEAPVEEEEVVALVIENHADEENPKEDESPNECEEVRFTVYCNEPASDTTATTASIIDDCDKEDEPELAEMINDFVDRGPDE